MNANVLRLVDQLEEIQAPGPDGVLGGETTESLDEAVRRASREAQEDSVDNVPRGDVVVDCHRFRRKPGEKGTDDNDLTVDPDDLRC